MGDDGGAAGMGNLRHGLMRCNNAAARARLPRGHELDWSRERATGFLLALTISFCVVPIDEIGLKLRPVTLSAQGQQR